MQATTANTFAPPSSDAELIRDCQCGKPDAFRELYRRHQKSVRAMLKHLCDPAILEDLVQEVFIKAWKGLPKMRGTAQFSTWLYRIAWNVGADYRRKMAQQRQRTHQQEIMYDLADNAPHTLLQLHHQDIVSRGLQHISPDHAIVIILHDLQDLPQADIAEILKIPTGTVKSRLFHARQTLRQFFHQEGISL